jgi:ribosomal protein L24E
MKAYGYSEVHGGLYVTRKTEWFLTCNEKARKNSAVRNDRAKKRHSRQGAKKIIRREMADLD